MKFRTLIRRNLRFHWRAHLSVVLGAAVGSAALIGALIVGDSVRESLKEKALSGLGHASFLLHSPDRYFSEELPMRARVMANMRALQGAYHLYQKTSSELPICINPELRERSLLVTSGMVSPEDAPRRLNRVQIIGVPDFAPVVFPAAATIGPKPARNLTLSNVCVVNSTLAQNLDASPGDVLLLRFNKATAVSVDSAISPKDGQTATLGLRFTLSRPTARSRSFPLFQQ